MAGMGNESPRDIDIIGCAQAGTIPGLFFRRAEGDPDRVAFSEFRDAGWTDFTWREIARRVGRFRAALDGAGIRPGDRVAIMLRNSPDWVAFDIAAMANGLITVPLYLHDSPENACAILASSGARLCFAESNEVWMSLAAHAARCDTLAHVWLRHGAGAPGRDAAPKVSALPDLVSGQEIGTGDIRCRPDDVATIIYTSGTTGPPKGAMLSHHALLWNAEAITGFIPPLKSDVFLSLLPLAHAFERTMGCYLPMMGGSRVAYARSVDRLRDDILEVRPTILIAVPRLYERLHAAITRKFARNAVTRLLARSAADIGWRRFEADHGRGAAPGPIARFLLWPLLERLVARPVLAAFGGRLRVAVSGGAPLSKEVSHFLIGLGLPLLEGYGLTEAAPVVTATTFEDNLPGSVGRPLHGVAVRVTEEGELQLRSPSVMTGYWNDPRNTAEAITEDGWLRTGDIAEIREGRIFIRGRLRDKIVLSTAKKVAPSEVETAIEADPLFEQVCVFGDDRPCLVAVAVLNGEAWQALAREAGLDAGAPNHPAATARLLARIARATEGLPSYSRVRGLHSQLRPWTIEDGTLTPTLKVRRHVIEARNRAEIGALYESLGQERRQARPGRSPKEA
jgi:long-chain acyl-CoA synthetase